MRLDMMTWQQVETRIDDGAILILPTGSTEQHGPMGFIGTDRICAEAIAERAAERADAIMAPALAYTPAPFNTGFGGTLSLSVDVFRRCVAEVFDGAFSQGFCGVFVLNGHGANLDPIRSAAEPWSERVRVRSWWDFDEVNQLRRDHYGDWEGMHATPSEIAITQALHRPLPPGDAADPPMALTPDYIAAHAGDRHGPPDQHRAAFPDGRVGSQSALARPEHGQALLDAAVAAVAHDLTVFASTLT